VSRKHDAALVALTAARMPNLFPGIVPVGFQPSPGSGQPFKPYAVFYSQPGTDRQTRLTGPAHEQNPRWTIHCVGSTADQAEWVNEQVKGALVVNGFGVVPTIAGENPGRFWYSNPQPVARDDDSTPPLFFVVAECGFRSELI